MDFCCVKMFNNKMFYFVCLTCIYPAISGQTEAEFDDNTAGNEMFSKVLSEDFNNETTYKMPLQIKFFTEFKLAMIMVKWILPVIIIFGTIGNSLSFLVLIRKRMCYNSVHFYLAMLACADTSVLYLSGFKTWLRAITGYEILHLSDGGCKFMMFLFLQSLHMAAWFVVAVSIDRFVAVWFPFKASQFCLATKTKSVTLCVFLTFALYNLHIFWTISLHQEKGGLQCSAYDTDYFMTKIYPWMKLASYSIVPFIFVFVLNVAVAYKVIQSHLSMKRNKSPPPMIKMSQYKVTIMLMVISLVWICCTIPFTLITFIEKNLAKTKDLHTMASIFLFKTFCFLLLYCNHAVNFLLYCLTSARFRRELAVVIFCKQTRCKNKSYDIAIRLQEG